LALNEFLLVDSLMVAKSYPRRFHLILDRLSGWNETRHALHVLGLREQVVCRQVVHSIT